MIIQEIKQGENVIKIESIESLEDGKVNNFGEGEYTRFYVNGKRTDNYMAMIQFIVAEAKNNKTVPIPNTHELVKQRNQMFDNQAAEINRQFDELKKQYKEMGIPDKVLDTIDDFKNKIDPTGVRVKR